MFTFKLRRDTAARWLVEDPVLADGEPGFETDTGRLKVGTGFKPWSELPYFVPADPDNASLADHVDSLTPHPVYDDGPSLTLLYENAKV